MRVLKEVAFFILYGVALGAITGVAAAVILHTVFGFSLVPCQLEPYGCQVGPPVQTLPIPHADLPLIRDPMGASLVSSRLHLLMLKASRER